ncbi:hypothetical protein V6N13_073736 [Hibiscus sabdariffa]
MWICQPFCPVVVRRSALGFPSPQLFSDEEIDAFKGFPMPLSCRPHLYGPWSQQRCPRYSRQDRRLDPLSIQICNRKGRVFVEDEPMVRGEAGEDADMSAELVVVLNKERVVALFDNDDIIAPEIEGYC